MYSRHAERLSRLWRGNARLASERGGICLSAATGLLMRSFSRKQDQDDGGLNG